MSLFPAAKAMRIPISRVRSATAQARTPYTPNCSWFLPPGGKPEQLTNGNHAIGGAYAPAAG
jgi:hypothetical protein